MDEKDRSRVQAENNGIAIGEINISGTVTGNISIGHTIIQAADAQLRRDLGILLKNVQNTWIKGALERSVHEAALLDLGMEIREEAVDNPWRMVMEAPDQTRETLPRGKKIKDIFYEANGLLLILGEPGSGKTTTLLQLARDLIAEIDQGFTQPVPIILNLSTWIKKEQLLNEWLVAELNSKYRLPKKDGQKWLAERRILPLLDGLDEVRTENRAVCVERINQLVKDYGLQAVVCSRNQDYMTLNVRLGFYRAIYIQPLTAEQVNKYLKSAGDKLASLRATLQTHETLKGMAQSPLILNIMSLAYQDTSADDLSDPSLATDKERRQHLFDTYIARMFNRKTRVYDDKLSKKYLTWLARNMQQHNQEMFLIEDLQPSWLQARYWRWVYILTSRLITWLIGGLLAGLILGVTLSPYSETSGLTRGLIFGPAVGIAVGFLDIFRIDTLNKWIGMRNFPAFWWVVTNIVIVYVIMGLVASIVGVFEFEEQVIFGLIAGLIAGLRGRRERLETDIQTVEALRWSGEDALYSGLTVGLIIGLISTIVGFCGALGTSTGIDPMSDLSNGLIGGLLIGLLAGLIGAIFTGLSSKIRETKSVPNEGIQLSIRNAILAGVVIGLVLGLLTLGWDTFIGLIFGLIGAFWYGGLDVIQHYTLRLILLVQGHTPANYARFLDYAVDRIFLQKVGGGYRFVHRLLLEHFADMSDSTKQV